MPGKNSKQSSVKTETPVAPKVETKVAPKVETKAVPKVEAKVETVPQKGGKKAVAKVEEAPKVVETPKVETPKVEAPKVEAKKAQKGGKKVEAKVEETPKVETKVEEPVAKKTAQKGGKKVAGKKTVAKKAVPKKVKKEEEQQEGEESGDRRIRSFKVKLPEKEEFEGRFTGLTPYQAANKALSKYFRETKPAQPEITFSICESTRKSKKAVYTYVGKRLELDEPVKYTIKNGDEERVITKKFKNSLKKVKKSEVSESVETA